MRTHDEHHDPAGGNRAGRRTSRPERTSGAAAIRGLQRRVGNRAVAGLLGDVAVAQRSDGDERRSPVLDVIARGGGRPLEPSLRATMEHTLGAGLGSVRVQTDARSNESIGARAYTVGENIVVHPGDFDAHSHAGRHLLAHETVHVVQQRRGPVDGRPAPGGIMISDPGDRFERAAEATASAVSAAAAEPRRPARAS